MPMEPIVKTPASRRNGPSIGLGGTHLPPFFFLIGAFHEYLWNGKIRIAGSMANVIGGISGNSPSPRSKRKPRVIAADGTRNSDGGASSDGASAFGPHARLCADIPMLGNSPNEMSG